MSNINIFGLGGFQENGKNLYCVEVDSRIFILDAGNKYPTSELYGIDSICPDISYLVKNKDRIEGIFLTHAHETHMGGVFQILREINVKVYATRFTMIILSESLKKNNVALENGQLITITSKSKFSFSTANISFFATSHNIPDCVGINVETPDGLIIYTGNYTFDQNSDADFLDMFKSLTSFGDKGVLALLSESKGSNDDQNRTTSQEMRLTLEKFFTDAPGRMIFSVFSSNLSRIQQVITMSLKLKKRIAIVGRNSQTIVDKAISNGYLNIPEESLVKLFYIDVKNKKHLNNEEDLVCLVIGERDEPYVKLTQMANGTDRLVHLEEKDSVIILTKPYLGTEKLAASALDAVYKVTTNVEIVSKNLLTGSSASREEIKQMINILKPKYIIPVIGEYSQFYGMREIAECLMINPKNVIFLDNGDVAGFTNKEYKGIVASVPVGEVLIDGPEFEDVNGFVMRDRELLAEDGLVMIVANINAKTKKVVKGPTIVHRGIFLDDEIILAIEKEFVKATKKTAQGKYINWSNYKNDIKDDVSRLLYKKLKQSPIVIPVIINTEK